ncbi:S66 peptidase family protein [Halobacillus litoralis]|uniref:S66 family peptidase n=1 Tax=Halobacillus litoralis TaxID=45668 RepID=UPI001CD3D211|nr:S66 peptidase family protein [Halobacillus litoralis]MCA1022627.1 LD-carboxypeptidase [Halobacillus litoralis]
MIPEKLKQGDEIRVISPSKSLSIVAPDQQELAVHRLRDMGFTVSFSTYAAEAPALLSNPVEHRISDIHEAFRDPHVKALLTTLGGYDSNQLLSHLDYDLIQAHPKIFCGYSDITALSNSIYQKTGLVTYSGPHFSTFGMKQGLTYTLEHFRTMFTTTAAIDIEPAAHWSDDAWYLDQEDRTFYPNQGPVVIHEGEASGTIIGGNLCTFNLLQGTAFMPDLAGTILFLEDDELSNPETFDRNLQSLIHQPGFDQVQGLVIGRFQNASNVDLPTLTAVIESKPELASLPVIADADFGHTSPIFTFPIGGHVEIMAEREQAHIRLHP